MATPRTQNPLGRGNGSISSSAGHNNSNSATSGQEDASTSHHSNNNSSSSNKGQHYPHHHNSKSSSSSSCIPNVFRRFTAIKPYSPSAVIPWKNVSLDTHWFTMEFINPLVAQEFTVYMNRNTVLLLDSWLLVVALIIMVSGGFAHSSAPYEYWENVPYSMAIPSFLIFIIELHAHVKLDARGGVLKSRRSDNSSSSALSRKNESAKRDRGFEMIEEEDDEDKLEGSHSASKRRSLGGSSIGGGGDDEEYRQWQQQQVLRNVRLASGLPSRAVREVIANRRYVLTVVYVYALGLSVSFGELYLFDRNCYEATDLLGPLGLRVDPRPRLLAEGKLSDHCSRVMNCFQVFSVVLAYSMSGAITTTKMLPAYLWMAFWSAMSYTLPIRSVAFHLEDLIVRWITNALIMATALVFHYRQHRGAQVMFQQEITLKLETDLAAEREEEVDTLLCNMLPLSALDRVSRGELVNDFTSEATVLFSDMRNFTQWSSSRDPQVVVLMLNTLTLDIDLAALACGVEKVKTIGDAYWAVSGLPDAVDDHADRICLFGARMLEIIRYQNVRHPEWEGVSFRIGVHSGQLHGAILGTQQMSYEVFGETSKIASLAEQHGKAGSVVASENTMRALSIPQSDWGEVVVTVLYEPGTGHTDEEAAAAAAANTKADASPNSSSDSSGSGATTLTETEEVEKVVPLYDLSRVLGLDQIDASLRHSTSMLEAPLASTASQRYPILKNGGGGEAHQPPKSSLKQPSTSNQGNSKGSEENNLRTRILFGPDGAVAGSTSTASGAKTTFPFPTHREGLLEIESNESDLLPTDFRRRQQQSQGQHSAAGVSRGGGPTVITASPLNKHRQESHQQQPREEGSRSTSFSANSISIGSPTAVLQEGGEAPHQLLEIHSSSSLQDNNNKVSNNSSHPAAATAPMPHFQPDMPPVVCADNHYSAASQDGEKRKSASSLDPYLENLPDPLNPLGERSGVRFAHSQEFGNSAAVAFASTSRISTIGGLASTRNPHLLSLLERSAASHTYEGGDERSFLLSYRSGAGPAATSKGERSAASSQNKGLRQKRRNEEAARQRRAQFLTMRAQKENDNAKMTTTPGANPAEVEMGEGEDESINQTLDQVLLHYGRRKYSHFFLTFADPEVEELFIRQLGVRQYFLRIAMRGIHALWLLWCLVSLPISGSSLSTSNSEDHAAIILFALAMLVGTLDFFLSALPAQVFFQPTRQCALHHVTGTLTLLAIGWTPSGKSVATNDPGYVYIYLGLLLGAGSLGFVSTFVIILVNLVVLVPVTIWMSWEQALFSTHNCFAFVCGPIMALTFHLTEKQYRLEFLQQHVAMYFKRKQEERNREQEALLRAMVPGHIVSSLMRWMALGMDPRKTIVHTYSDSAVGFIQIDIQALKNYSNNNNHHHLLTTTDTHGQLLSSGGRGHDPHGSPLTLENENSPLFGAAKPSNQRDSDDDEDTAAVQLPPMILTGMEEERKASTSYPSTESAPTVTVEVMMEEAKKRGGINADDRSATTINVPGATPTTTTGTTNSVIMLGPPSLVCSRALSGAGSGRTSTVVSKFSRTSSEGSSYVESLGRAGKTTAATVDKKYNKTTSALQRTHSEVDRVLASFSRATKIKTVGDIVMLAGPFVENGDTDVTRRIGKEENSSTDQQQLPPERVKVCGQACDEMLTACQQIGLIAPVRAGMHFGTIVGAVQGTSRLCFDVFGDTVNTASRVMTAGRTGDIGLSEEFHHQFEKYRDLHYQTRSTSSATNGGSGASHNSTDHASSPPAVVLLNEQAEFSDEPIQVEAKGKGAIRIYRLLRSVD